MVLERIVVLKLNDKRYLPTLPKAMQSENVRKLESEFKPNSRDILRGLTPELERLVLPDFIGVQPDDVQFSNRTKEFWADFSIQPDATGIQLNIATEKKKTGTEKISVQVEILDGAGNGTGKFKTEEKEVDVLIDYPVNPEDYWTWHIAMQSSKVAKTPSDFQSLNNFDFYLEDLQAIKDKERDEFEIVEKADMEYVKLITGYEQNVEKIDWIIELLRDKTQSMDVDTLDPTTKKMTLKKLKDSKPNEFLTTAKDQDLELKAFIIKCTTFGVITKEGNTYFNGEESLGTGKEAVAYLKKGENSGKLLVLRTRLKEKMETRNNR